MVLLISLFLTNACSKTGNEFSRLEQLQHSKEQLLQQGYDTNMKIQVCNEIIDSLRAFTHEHPKGEWNQKAVAAINSWQIRKSAIERDRDYEHVMKVQQTSNETQGYTSDYDIKIKSCDDVIASIRDFKAKHYQDEATPLLTTALSSWESRRAAYEQELNALYERAYELNKIKAIRAAEKWHSLSDIEEINLVSRDKKKDGNKIYVADSYHVRMRGRLIGTHIFKLNVKIESCISMDTKIVEMSRDPCVEE
jgi:hypothetical protein